MFWDANDLAGYPPTASEYAFGGLRGRLCLHVPPLLSTRIRELGTAPECRAAHLYHVSQAMQAERPL
jgi:hypothetical protein